MRMQPREKALLRLGWVWPGLLLLAVVAAYARAGGFAYIGLDDPFRVSQNPHVLSGLTWDNLRWAFMSRESADSYPLTWISFQVVAQVFGPAAGPQHLANVLLHALNSLLVFQLFKSMTGRIGLSAVVAGLFALHPLHVESVAWVSGRKDVLSTVFWLLAMQAYAAFTRTSKARDYLLVVLCFVLGLMAKSMLVTLPMTLLILDYWPLGRFVSAFEGRSRFAGLWHLLREKIPLFAVAGLGSLLTFDAQSGVGAVYSWAELPLSLRLANAATSVMGYLQRLLWPSNLAVFYPHPGFRISLLKAVLAMLALAGLSVLAWRTRRSHPYGLAGWLWFGVTLLPVIGIVQIGTQAMADRYTYVSLIGPFWILAWGSLDLANRIGLNPRTVTLGWSMGLTLCTLTSYRQVGFWRDSRTLFERAKQVTERNWLAHLTLGKLHLQRREFAQAAKEFRAAVNGTPSLQGGSGYLGVALMGMGRPQEAMEAFRTEFGKNPKDASVNLCMGILHAVQDRPHAALPYLRIAAEAHDSNVLELERIEFQAYLWLGRAHHRLGHLGQAETALIQAEHLDPGSPEVADERAMLNHLKFHHSSIRGRSASHSGPSGRS